MDSVRCETVDGRTVVTLDNPDLRNALTVEMATELSNSLDSLDDSVRCVVLQGAGKTFCAGGDIEAMLEIAHSESEESAQEVSDDRLETVARPIVDAVRTVYECPVPTVAKVDGPAFGAGAALALACDVVLASERAEMSFGFRQVGLSVDSGTSYLLPRVVGLNVAKELVYTGELVDADRGEAIGLFNQVYPADEFEQRTHGFIDRIASGPTAALRESKRLLNRSFERSFDEAVEAELEGVRRTASTDDHVEGVTAFVEGRDPEFEGE
jgi:enoyl-CoA hydratase/carnithine racemase